MSAPAARTICPRCQRPTATCLCALVSPVANEVELLLLQHPLEQHQAKGTARLLQLSLARCRLEVGERFDPALLGGGTAALLYPPGPGDPVRTAAELGDLRCLVVLDATWDKSRKLLHLNPWLHDLPRLALSELPASRYAAIRKARQAHQLSTLEASLLALQQLEGRPERYAPLWTAFDAFVAQTRAYRPGAPAV